MGNRRSLINLIGYIKGFILFLRPHVLLDVFRNPLLTISNFISLTKWISEQNRYPLINDFYSLKRNYSKRYLLYKQIIDEYKLDTEAIVYFEFGVSEGFSFKWWLENCINVDSKFYGFDTFDGLPENWGTYSKGDMKSHIPIVNDPRGTFIEGLFQDTFNKFIENINLNSNNRRKVVHLDADLFSSTLFVLFGLESYLRKGDILIFDEFNVPNHEFSAFKIFCETYYVKPKLIGAVNNYLQVAFVIE